MDSNEGYHIVFKLNGPESEVALPFAVSEKPWEWQVRVVGYSLSYTSPLRVDDPLFICCNIVSPSTLYQDSWLPSLITIPLEKTKGRFIGSDLIDNPYVSLVSCADISLSVKPRMPSSGYVILQFQRKSDQF